MEIGECMWITKEMQDDIDNKITWNPRATNWINTLEDISDALSIAGYKIEIIKES